MSWHNPLSKKHQTRRGNKFGAIKVKEGAETYDSKGERELHGYLKLMERAGQVKDIVHHPAAIQITQGVKWKVDYRVFDLQLNDIVFHEYKGLICARFRVIMQLWPEFGPKILRIWTKKNNRMEMIKEIKGCGGR